MAVTQVNYSHFLKYICNGKVLMENPTNNDSNALVDFPESLSARELHHFNKILAYIQMCNHEKILTRKFRV